MIVYCWSLATRRVPGTIISIVLFTKYQLAPISGQNIVFVASVVGNELVFAVGKVVVRERICWVGRSEDGCRGGKWWDVMMMRSYFVTAFRERISGMLCCCCGGGEPRGRIYILVSS